MYFWQLIIYIALKKHFKALYWFSRKFKIKFIFLIFVFFIGAWFLLLLVSFHLSFFLFLMSSGSLIFFNLGTSTSVMVVNHTLKRSGYLSTFVIMSSENVLIHSCWNISKSLILKGVLHSDSNNICTKIMIAPSQLNSHSWVFEASTMIFLDIIEYCGYGLNGNVTHCVRETCFGSKRFKLFTWDIYLLSMHLL